MADAPTVCSYPACGGPGACLAHLECMPPPDSNWQRGMFGQFIFKPQPPRWLETSTVPAGGSLGEGIRNASSAGNAGVRATVPQRDIDASLDDPTACARVLAEMHGLPPPAETAIGVAAVCSDEPQKGGSDAP